MSSELCMCHSHSATQHVFAGEESHYNITHTMLRFNIYTPGTTGECWGFISAMGREEGGGLIGS